MAIAEGACGQFSERQKFAGIAEVSRSIHRLVGGGGGSMKENSPREDGLMYLVYIVAQP